MKTAIQRATFWKEVNIIQQRHLLFFPDEQKKYIKIRKTGIGGGLYFREGHNLPSAIIMEIQLAFKLAGGTSTSTLT
ncbi:MAG: hypothetical protein ABI707_13565 [Ferruginibacter sp.]